MNARDVQVEIGELFAGLIHATPADLVSLRDPLNCIRREHGRPATFGRGKVTLLIDRIERELSTTVEYSVFSRCETPEEIIDAGTKAVLMERCPREGRKFRPARAGHRKLGTTPHCSGRWHPDSILW